MATPAPSTPVTQSDALAKVQVKVVEGVQSHWSHLARLAGLAQPLSESEIMKMTRMNESDKRGGFERERPRKKLQVDELGMNNL